MTECQPSLLSWGDPSIAWIVEHLREPWLSPIMANISHLGETGPLLMIVALSYWFWDKRKAKYITYAMLLSLFINLWLKNWIKECRPPSQFWLENITASSYSFPSGHAQVTIVFWVGCAYYLFISKSQPRWIYRSFALLFAGIGVLIALSRPYLGVHYIHDIVAGALLGLTVLGICLFCEKKSYEPLKKLPLWGQTAFLCTLLTLYLLCHNETKYGLISVAYCLGYWLGSQWEAKLLQLAPCWQPSKRFSYNIHSLFWQGIIGITGIALLYQGGDLWFAHLPEKLGATTKFIQYALLGGWVSFGAAALFIKCKLRQARLS